MIQDLIGYVDQKYCRPNIKLLAVDDAIVGLRVMALALLLMTTLQP